MESPVCVVAFPMYSRWLHCGRWTLSNKDVRECEYESSYFCHILSFVALWTYSNVDARGCDIKG